MCVYVCVRKLSMFNICVNISFVTRQHMHSLGCLRRMQPVQIFTCWITPGVELRHITSFCWLRGSCMRATWRVPPAQVPEYNTFNCCSSGISSLLNTADELLWKAKRKTVSIWAKYSCFICTMEAGYSCSSLRLICTLIFSCLFFWKPFTCVNMKTSSLRWRSTLCSPFVQQPAGPSAYARRPSSNWSH